MYLRDIKMIHRSTLPLITTRTGWLFNASSG